MGWFLKFTGLSKLGGLLAAAGAFLVVAGIALLKAFTAGRRKEQAKQMEKANEVREKMDAVPDSSRDDTSDSLRKGKF